MFSRGSMDADAKSQSGIAVTRGVIIAVTSFLTQVDLFAAQAILPTLTEEFEVTPAVAGAAVNASTLGMAVAGLVIAAIGARIDRKRGIVASLFALCVPTLLLGLTSVD